MKRIATVAVAGLLFFGGQEGTAQEPEGPASWFSGNVAITSDYVFRGISQTLRNPAIQGGVDVSVPAGFYAGLWGSSLNFGEDLTGGSRAQVELDLYGGFSREALGTSWQLGVTYYGYPGAAVSRSYDFVEVGLGAARDFGVVQAKASFAYAPDFFAGCGPAAHALGELRIPLSSIFSLGIAAGRQTIHDHTAFGAGDYTYWQVPVSAELSGFKVTAAYVATDLSRSACFDGSDLCDARAVFTLSRNR